MNASIKLESALTVGGTDGWCHETEIFSAWKYHYHVRESRLTESVGFGVGLADGDVVGVALGLDVGASMHCSDVVSQKPEQQAPGS